jgi:hypothetical protein
MHGFGARHGVEASFGDVEFGVVEALDIGEYEDPAQAFDQYYVFRVRRRQDVVRWQSAVDAPEIEGRLQQVVLHCPEGATYQAEAACVNQRKLDNGRFEYVFEAQLPPEITAPARERHGVDSLAAALLLDAVAHPRPGRDR